MRQQMQWRASKRNNNNNNNNGETVSEWPGIKAAASENYTGAAFRG